MWNMVKMLFYARTAVYQCNFDRPTARMFQRASREFGISTIIGPPGGDAWYPGLVGLYYPSEDERRRSNQDGLKDKINERFYELQRNPIRMFG